MNNSVVVDANIALKWVLTEADSSIARALLAEWTRKRIAILAPALLVYEVTNILYREVCTGKITFDTARNAINTILRAIALDFSQNSGLNLRAMTLANEFGLPASYDTHYLALAEREDCELWTADTRMWRVVKGQLDWVHCLADYSASESQEL